MSIPMQRLVLKSNADRRLKRGHLWIYSNEVNITQSPLKSFSPGEQALVVSHGGQPLGIATVNPNTLICGRLVSRDSEIPLNKSLLVHKINQADAIRSKCFSEPYYRVLYGDSDFVPGLVVDRFGDYLVAQISTAGMENVKEDIVAALQQCFRPKGILLKNDHSGRSLEGLPSYCEKVGDIPDSVPLIENGTQFMAPIVAGQKTGWFYDHRANRETLQKLASGSRVLDVFSYIGGWGIQAAVGGASEVVCVDASEQALDWLDENARLNGVQDRIATFHGKAINVLKALISEGEKFDIVVLDPPAFIKRRKDQKSGEGAYRHINELGMRLLNRNGILVSASCSMHLSRESLVDIIRGAGRHLDRQVQILTHGGQGLDHPIHPAIVETDYLKASFVSVNRP